jgi:ATP-binding cassette subfamily F protein uup
MYFDGWNWEQRVDETLHRLHLDRDARIGSLSGGNRKRVALAQALVRRPDVLLLDEPTNHLDLDSIEWLENLLIDFRGSVVLITHDRSLPRPRRHPHRRAGPRQAAFLSRQLHPVPGAEGRATGCRKPSSTPRPTSCWRRKKSGSARAWKRAAPAAKAASPPRSPARSRTARRDVQGASAWTSPPASASGKIVAELTEVSTKSFGEKTVVRDFSATILRGDKVGLLGPNGAGKTTLLKLILGELEPDSGKCARAATCRWPTSTRCATRSTSTPRWKTSSAPAASGSRSASQRKHVKSYLGDFLFSPARANSPVRSLSGGERNRLLLARLFARPANVLVLDEPTNDLDIDTLELLEGLLQDYDGTVFLVSHDRTFLDNVVTSTIAFEGDGRWREYEGGVQDWLIQSKRAREIAEQRQAASFAPATRTRARRSRAGRARRDRPSQEAQLQGAARRSSAGRSCSWPSCCKVPAHNCRRTSTARYRPPFPRRPAPLSKPWFSNGGKPTRHGSNPASCCSEALPPLTAAGSR